MIKRVEFYFLLDRTFKKGTDTVDVKRKRKAGKNIDNFYNPNPTSIYIGCSVNSEYVKVNVGWKIRPAEWDFVQQEPHRKYKNHLELKNLLNSILLKVERDYLILLTNETSVTAQAIREIMIRAVLGKIPVVKEKVSFWAVYEEFIAEKSKATKESTILKYNSTKAALEGFERKYYALTFEKMDMQFYRDYKVYSVEVLNHLNNTISKNLRNIKTFLGWAEIHPKKYLTNTDYKRFKGDNDEPEPIYLNESELQRIVSFKAADSVSQQKSRDIFVFQCYTGQRIGDVLAVRKQDIRLVDNGPAKEWVLYQQKGNKKHPIYIPILDAAEEILNRYCKDIADGDLIFPGQTTVMLNKNLKKIAKAAKIDTVITKVNYCGKKRIQVTKPKYSFIGSHTARKTFISLSLQWGMRPEQLKSITGHTSVKQMNPYIGNDKDRLTSDLKSMWNRTDVVQGD
ncbi:MAG: site-specific integrase [Taibaiella sp.]|nr:site-specific integrase [Taibaiella sp.]